VLKIGGIKYELKKLGMPGYNSIVIKLFLLVLLPLNLFCNNNMIKKLIFTVQE